MVKNTPFTQEELQALFDGIDEAAARLPASTPDGQMLKPVIIAGLAIVRSVVLDLNRSATALAEIADRPREAREAR